MKILFVGDDWLGSNARSLAEGFRARGHEIMVIDSTPATLPPRLSPSWAYAKSHERRAPWTVEHVHTRLERAAAELRPDLVFAFKSVHLDQRRLLDIPAALHVHYSPDDVSNPVNTTPSYLATESEWDLVVTTKRHNVRELLDRGARNALFVRSAYDPAWHHPSARRTSRQYLVGFIGACRPDRRDGMVSLARTYGAQLLVRGPGWRRVRQLRTTRAEIGGAVYGEDFSIAVASVTANLVLLNSDNRDTHTCRTFEVPAAGGLFVGERTDEHAELLSDGAEAYLFSSRDELDDILERCVAFPDEVAKVAAAGHRRIVEGGHSYADRAEEILRALG
ncbi:CgeB family protein [Nocardia bovistercoris]|uniref:Glycosyltransferase n=1 Tax=Nocardia bovistercoris TaxID=2785916 RepID=A0A931I5T8_9NOCA|nr:glycosyltransferase [Nocardia bovistercoris]MBH0774746.1 glycosyltransferase [Nocardia bovistercoris]